LINASPDLRMQILGDPEFAPRGDASRHSPIGAVVLTGTEVDQVMGLLHLREFQPLQIFCSAQAGKSLREGNSLLRVVNRENQMQWQRFEPGKAWRFPAAGGGRGERLSIEAVPLDGDGGVVGLWIECGDSRMFCAPSLPDVDEKLALRLNECDVVLVDGTFWSDDELVRVRGAGKTAREMGHLPISGAEGTMAKLASMKKPRKIFVHVNNTNPILDEDSAEYREVRSAGWEVGTDGMEIRL
jgi:pyrroloquinoline quinone biosynthesis protein B